MEQRNGASSKLAFMRSCCRCVRQFRHETPGCHACLHITRVTHSDRQKISGWPICRRIESFATVRPSGIYSAARAQRFIWRAPALGYRYPVCLHGTNVVRVRRQRKMDERRQRCARFQPCVAHLDARLAAPYPPARGNGLRGAEHGWPLVGAQAQAQLPVSRASALKGISGQVPFYRASSCWGNAYAPRPQPFAHAEQGSCSTVHACALHTSQQHPDFPSHLKPLRRTVEQTHRAIAPLTSLSLVAVQSNTVYLSLLRHAICARVSSATDKRFSLTFNEWC